MHRIAVHAKKLNHFDVKTKSQGQEDWRSIRKRIENFLIRAKREKLANERWREAEGRGNESGARAGDSAKAGGILSECDLRAHS